MNEDWGDAPSAVSRAATATRVELNPQFLVTTGATYAESYRSLLACPRTGRAEIAHSSTPEKPREMAPNPKKTELRAQTSA